MLCKVFPTSRDTVIKVGILWSSGFELLRGHRSVALATLESIRHGRWYVQRGYEQRMLLKRVTVNSLSFPTSNSSIPLATFISLLRSDGKVD